MNAHLPPRGDRLDVIHLVAYFCLPGGSEIKLKTDQPAQRCGERFHAFCCTLVAQARGRSRGRADATPLPNDHSHWSSTHSEKRIAECDAQRRCTSELAGGVHFAFGVSKPAARRARELVPLDADKGHSSRHALRCIVTADEALSASPYPQRHLLHRVCLQRQPRFQTKRDSTDPSPAQARYRTTTYSPRGAAPLNQTGEARADQFDQLLPGSVRDARGFGQRHAGNRACSSRCGSRATCPRQGGLSLGPLTLYLTSAVNSFSLTSRLSVSPVLCIISCECAGKISDAPSTSRHVLPHHQFHE